MKLQSFTYILTVAFFISCSVLIAYVRRDRKILLRYEKVILFVILISILYTPFDYFALHWHAWNYSSEGTLNIRFFAEVETYGFAIAVSLILASVTLVIANRIDKQSSAIKAARTRKRRSLGLRKRSLVAASTKR
jgi:lycopene cyclase domain-containing protein